MRGRVGTATFLGIVPGTRQGVGVALDARVRGSYLVGVTGAGKSTLMLGMICQDLRAGRGLCLLDPNGDLVDDVIARVSGFRREDDVLLLDLQASEAAFGLNLFACSDPGDSQAVAQTAERVVGVFKKIWGSDSWGPRMQDLLANAALTLVANPGTTLADLPRLLTDAAYRHGLTSNLANAVVREYWRREYDPLSEAARHQVYAPLTNKVRDFLRNPLLLAVVSQSSNSVDLRAAIAARKIVLVRLDPMMEEATNLLGAIFLQQLLEAAFARRDLALAARVPFMVYADEAHRFATSTFVTLLREARKYGLATTAATQLHSLLPPDVATAFTNSATVVSFQLVPEDARALQLLYTGATVPRPFVPDVKPLATLLRHGSVDHELVEAAMAVERGILRHQMSYDARVGQARAERQPVSPAMSRMRQARLLIDEILYTAMVPSKRNPWPELSALTEGDFALLSAVAALAKRLAVSPVSADRNQRPDVAHLLGRLPAHHALVRYREGTRVTEAFVRTLPTRPMGRPVAIHPLGAPRPRLDATNALRASQIIVVDEATEPGDGPPPMFVSREGQSSGTGGKAS